MFEKTLEISKDKLRFHIIKTNKFKMSRLSFNFILPADKVCSPKYKLMLSVMMRGSKNYPTIAALNKRLDELYCATVSCNTVSIGANHIFRVSCEMISDKYRFPDDNTDVLKEVLSFVFEILLNPLLDENGLLLQSYIDSEKKIAIDAIKAKINDHKAYSAEQCKINMLGEDRSGISVYGTEELINSFTAKDLTDGIESFFESSTLECYYVGDGNAEILSENIGKAFSKYIKKEGAPISSEIAFKSLDADKEKEFCEKMNISQGRLNVGCTCDTVMSDREYYAMSLCNDIFGGLSVSKLFMNVREKKSLCYYCHSSYNSANGTVMISCGIKPENKDKALKEIRKQLHDMQSGKFTEDELENSKKTAISGLLQTSDSPSAIEAFKLRRFLAGVEDGQDSSCEKIMKVSRKDVISAAKKIKINTVYFLSGEGDGEVEENE